MAKVSVRNVSQIYRGHPGQNVTAAVKDLNLEVTDREFVVLAGPPGCGKSTILRLIAGFEETSQGDIFIGEKRMNGIAPKDRDLAMVFQDDALYPHMSVFDNLGFGLKLRKFSKAEIKRRVVDAAGILGMEGLLERKPPVLSREQRQRVAIGRAIVRQPKVLLFDEPLSRLDAKLRVQMRSEIVKLHERLQATLVYATHDATEAMTMGDRIVVLNEGAVQQSDPPLTVYNEPANLFVAGFFGSPPMNFITGTLRAEGGNLRFCEIEEGTIDLAFPADSRPAAREFVGKPVVLGIRPEDLEVAQSPRKDGRKTVADNVFPAIVDIVEPMGAETYFYFQTGAHTLVCRSQDAFDRREAGRRFHFQVNLNKAHLFDPDTARRLISEAAALADA